MTELVKRKPEEQKTKMKTKILFAAGTRNIAAEKISPCFV